MNELLVTIGLPPAEECSITLAGQRRGDGWSAAEAGRAEAARRREMLHGLRKRGLLPTSVRDQVVLDLGCGIASTGMALADEAKLVVGSDLFRSHCISAVERVNEQK